MPYPHPIHSPPQPGPSEHQERNCCALSPDPAWQGTRRPKRPESRPLGLGAALPTWPTAFGCAHSCAPRAGEGVPSTARPHQGTGPSRAVGAGPPEPNNTLGEHFLMMSKPGPRRFQLQPLALPRLPRPTPHLCTGGPSAGLADTTCGDSQAAGCGTGRTDRAARSGLTAVAERSAPRCLQGPSRRTPRLPLHPPCFTPLAVPPTRSARLWSKRNQEPVVRPGNRWWCYFESCLVARAGLW